MSTATRSTAPLPPKAVAAMARLDARLAGRSVDPVVAEQHRIERIAAGLRVGESAVINGVECTAVSLAEAAAIMSASDVLAHEAGSYVRSTPEVDKAVVRYEIASATFDRLSQMDARDMSGNQFTLMAESQAEMAERRAFLESVGQLHRIETR